MLLWRPAKSVLYLYPGRGEMKYGSLGLILYISLSFTAIKCKSCVWEILSTGVYVLAETTNFILCLKERIFSCYGPSMANSV